MLQLSRIVFIGIIFILSDQSTRSQDNNSHHSNLTLTYSLHSGKVFPNHGNFPSSNLAIINDFSMGYQSAGRRDWHHIYNFPEVSMNIFHGQLGNDEVFGDVTGFVPSISFVSKRPGRWQSYFRFGIGLGYFNKPYDTITNRQNKVIGSSVTNFSTASFFLQYNISKHFSGLLGISALHGSNGHYQVPNAGLNVVLMNAGFKYYPFSRFENSRRTDIIPPNGRIKFNTRLGWGVHEFAGTYGPVGGPKYNVFTLAVYASKRFGKVSNVTAGFEGKYYEDYYKYITTNDVFNGNYRLNSTVISFIASHELMIDRFALVTQGGLDFFTPFYSKYYNVVGSKKGVFQFVEKYLSSRIGEQYYLFETGYNSNHNVFLGLYVKAHFGQADFVSMDIGFTL